MITITPNPSFFNTSASQKTLAILVAQILGEYDQDRLPIMTANNKWQLDSNNNYWLVFKLQARTVELNYRYVNIDNLKVLEAVKTIIEFKFGANDN